MLLGDFLMSITFHIGDSMHMGAWGDIPSDSMG